MIADIIREELNNTLKTWKMKFLRYLFMNYVPEDIGKFASTLSKFAVDNDGHRIPYSDKHLSFTYEWLKKSAEFEEAHSKYWHKLSKLYSLYSGWTSTLNMITQWIFGDPY